MKINSKIYIRLKLRDLAIKSKKKNIKSKKETIDSRGQAKKGRQKLQDLPIRMVISEMNSKKTITVTEKELKS